MKFTTAEIIMYSTLQIHELNEQQQTIGAATGFAVAFNASDKRFMPVLVTNRHVLSNCKYVKLIFTRKKDDGTPDTGNTISAIIDVCLSAFHPDANIDLAALPLGPTFNELKNKGTPAFCPCIRTSLIPSDEQWSQLDAIEQIVTAGYPEGLRDKVNNLPIIRSGITATHPAFNYQGNPEFLADMTCFKGCSGSPVFILGKEISMDNSDSEKTTEKPRVFLLGVQHSIQVVRTEGTLENSPDSMNDVKPVIQLPMNLAVVVKSSELLVLESTLNSIAGQTV